MLNSVYTQEAPILSRAAPNLMLRHRYFVQNMEIQLSTTPTLNSGYFTRMFSLCCYSRTWKVVATSAIERVAIRKQRQICARNAELIVNRSHINGDNCTMQRSSLTQDDRRISLPRNIWHRTVKNCKLLGKSWRDHKYISTNGQQWHVSVVEALCSI